MTTVLLLLRLLYTPFQRNLLLLLAVAMAMSAMKSENAFLLGGLGTGVQTDGCRIKKLRGEEFGFRNRR
uniref:Putative secreted protein n=1 Tax=Anopheles triannulatus TaxID=58253 RepID=A0A2M4B4A0_9DIPT